MEIIHELPRSKNGNEKNGVHKSEFMIIGKNLKALIN
jgi:hypothetical protein